MKYLIIFIVLVFFTHFDYKCLAENIIETPSFLVSDVVVTSNKIIAGEMDTRLWNKPYNGVYVSSDVGKNWTKVGLEARGITKLATWNGSIYATTYYFKDNHCGLYEYKTNLGTWQHLGPDFTINTMYVNEYVIVVGTPSQGLWVSLDKGITWEQKIGDGWAGPNITNITEANNSLYAMTPDKVFQSNDNGISWNENAAFSNKGFRDIKFLKGMLFGCSGGKNGFYTSSDNGNSWFKQNLTSSFECQYLYSDGNNMYIGIGDENDKTIKIVVWDNPLVKHINTDVHYSNRIKAIQKVYTDKTLLVLDITYNGIITIDESPQLFRKPIMALPWQTATPEKDILSLVTSYFDHELPLLGYGLLHEPSEVASTTTTFYGERQHIPTVYYSSHNGIDFGLPYGTNVIAVDQGNATYYYCNDCGNTIKIDHGNGYQSVYMHLQKDRLVTTSGPIKVEKGQVIGKVGLTGKTTGPHLHFQVENDSNNNGSYDYPDELTDPFGWQATFKDPWEIYTWEDPLKNHKGNRSLYLWSTDLPQISKNILHDSINLQGINLGPFDLEDSITIKLNLDSIPYQEELPFNTSYFPKTAFSAIGYDLLNKSITYFQKPFEITINLSEESLNIFKEDTLKIYYYDNNTNTWIALPTSVLNTIDKSLRAETNHLSKFAVLGQLNDSQAPTTIEVLSGHETNSLIITSIDNIDPAPTIFFSLNNDTDWQEYSNPIELENTDINEIYYKAMDYSGNISKANVWVATNNSISTKNGKTVRIVNNGFSIADN